MFGSGKALLLNPKRRWTQEKARLLSYRQCILEQTVSGTLSANYSSLEIVGLALKPQSLIEPSIVMEIFVFNCSIQRSSLCPHMAVKPLKCGWCDWETECLILLNSNLKERHMAKTYHMGQLSTRALFFISYKWFCGTKSWEIPLEENFTFLCLLVQTWEEVSRQKLLIACEEVLVLTYAVFDRGAEVQRDI